MAEPQPIKQEDIHILRTTDPVSGQVVTKYVDANGQEIAGPRPTYHLQKASAGFVPPPS